ncbi:hypothetical protein Zmor_014850 [Zophobas morio]|uniref:F-box domain-containing protein n=1 Tax=Zophobas morio TaxID=2755281 RepID=A0AA38MGR0_9CUCU|nr:hypothetical protein Zmor_014850 [Zophobas morio]
MWTFLPFPALYKIFQHLDYKDLLSASEVCQSWYEVSRDDFLWKKLFFLHFGIDKSVPIISGKTWYEEFKRLCYNVPVVQTETCNEHRHQVLHVSFSHNGKYFATCSKDGYVLLWNSTYPVEIKYSRDMNSFSWKYTQYSQFNESDTLLLVSGVHFGTPHSTSGEIAVFNLMAGFELQCRVVNKPYDIYGTWYNDQHLLSGDLHWLAHLVSSSSLWLNKASQEAESEHVPITHNMFRFYNRNASSIRAIMIAKCLPNSEFATGDEVQEEELFFFEDRRQPPEHGNPVSHRDINAVQCTHDSASVSVDNSKVKSSNVDLGNPIWYNSDYRQVESEFCDELLEDSDDDFEEDDFGKDEVEDESSEEEGEQLTRSDKYLIFTTGYKTYTPHQIGFKRIKPFTFPKRLDPGPSLKERLILRERKKELLRQSSPPPDPNWLDFESVADRFDKIDHVIDLHGHIVGMGLSPDHRYLYVNSRSWPQGYKISNPLDPPPIAQEIDIHVIDLVTLKQVGTMLRAHKAYTSNSECFFIFLDVCNQYVASGAEDKHGYLWDRHYGVCLVKYPHADVVNSVAFNPKDPEMLVTTSDDHTIKVWRSRSKVKELNLFGGGASLPTGIEFRKNRSKDSKLKVQRCGRRT